MSRAIRSISMETVDGSIPADYLDPPRNFNC
jgi:hypothetical protein